MNKLDLVRYISLGASKLTKLQKGRMDTAHQKNILRKAAQEAAGLTYNKASNFALNLTLPQEGEFKKVANRLKASELEAIAKHFDNEILRVKAYIAEKENEEVAATEEEDMDNEIMQDEIAQEQAAKFEDEISRIALYDTREIDRIVYESESVKIFNSESPYGKTFTIAPDGKITRQYLRDDIMNKHATAYKLNERIYKLVYSPFCTWFVYVS